MPYSLIVDILVAGLLVVTIGYAVRLNKRLGMLRRDKGELEKLAATFAESTVRADDSLGRLRATADMMQRQIDSAQALHDDLAYLVDRGEKAADRLEDAVRYSREFDRRPAQNSPAPETESEEPVPAPQPRSGANAASAAQTERQPRPAPEIADINEGMSRPAPKVQRPDPERGEDGVSARTEAERELLKALRSAN